MTVRSGVGRPSSVFRATERYVHDAKAIGENVRRVRHSKGLTLEQAANRMEGDFRHFQRIEAGKVNLTLATMLRVAEALGVPLTQLFHDVGASEAEPSEGESAEPPDSGQPFTSSAESARLLAHEQREELGTEMLCRIGQRVASLRHQRGLSSTGLARLAGISMLLLQGIERGEHSELTVRQLVQLSHALGVAEEILLAHNSDENTQ